MDIVKARTQDRSQRINIIAATLKKAFAAGLSVDREKMILESCSNLVISRRTALEYLDIALVSVNCTEEIIDGRKVFIQKEEVKHETPD